MMTLAAVLAFFLVTPATSTPESVVKDLYTHHFAHEQRFDLTIKQDRAQFAPALLTLLDADAKAAAANKDEIVGLDFDPLTNSQEQNDGWTMGTAKVEGASAAVPVETRVATEKAKLTVRLVKSADRWQVSDIDYGETTLVKELQQLAADRQKK
jgi:hypothetical protein